MYIAARLMRGLPAHGRAACALLCLFVFAVVASTASARPGALAVAWQAPTPADGTKLKASPSPPPAKRKPKPPAVRTLSGVNHTYRWAKLRNRTAARSGPSRSARVVDVLPFLTPENTQNIVALLEARRIKGKEWVKVRLAKLPNSSVGWVRRADLGAFRLVRTRLVVNRANFTATLYKAGKKVFRARIGVGQPHWPTPRGEYYIRMKLCCYGNAIYGPYAFGLSARSPVLTDWPGGGFIGIHGTNAPGLIPGRISHGCIRMRNSDITRLNRLLSTGTPVSVR